MAKFVAKIQKKDFDLIQNKIKMLQSPLRQADANDIGKAVVKEMKAKIAKGNSPMKGAGFQTRFPKYKDPKKYPGNRKSKSPVNLTLTGALLKNLKHKALKLSGGRWGISIGYRKRSEQKKEQGHREGANTQPKRPTIPAGSGETFANSVQKVYLAKILKIHRKIAKRRG